MREPEEARRKRRTAERIKRGLLGATALLGAAKLKDLESEKKLPSGAGSIGAILASAYGVPNLYDAFKD